jgi:hypothetical protein
MAGSLPDRTLWRDETGGRHFLVPSDAALPPGPLLLRSGATRSASVAPGAVAPYQVTKDEARAFLDAQVEAWAAQAKQDLAAVFAPWRGPDRAEGSAPADSAGADPASGPGVRLFSALSGEPAQAVASDPHAFVRGLATLLGEAAAVVQRAGEGPDGEADARERIRQLGETLRAHGISAPSPAPEKPS